jgi:hypothetical protein
VKNPALYRAWRKATRTLLQMAAAGSLTALVDLLAHGLSPATAGAVLAVWGVVVAFLHNYLETAGAVPVLLPTPGLVPSVAPITATAVGTVETTIDHVGNAVGDVTGVVEDLGGKLLGEVNPPGEGDQ